MGPHGSLEDQARTALTGMLDGMKPRILECREAWAFDGGILEVWDAKDILPPVWVAICQIRGDETIVMSAGENEFRNGLRALRPPMSDARIMSDLVDAGVFGRRRVVKEPRLRAMVGDWPPPERCADGSVVLHVANFRDGTIEKITVGADYSLALNKVGSGYKVSLL